MTITEDERKRLVGESDEIDAPAPSLQRSGAFSSLLGMLTALGLFVLLSATVSAIAVSVDVEFDLIGASGEFQELTATGFIVAAVIVFTSLLAGGYTAGRLAGHGRGLVGIGVSLWMTLAFAIFMGLGLWVGAESTIFDGSAFADRLSGIDVLDTSTDRVIAAAGLFVVAVLGGLLGGRLGVPTWTDTTEMVVDIRDVEPETKVGETEIRSEHLERQRF